METFSTSSIYVNFNLLDLDLDLFILGLFKLRKGALQDPIFKRGADLVVLGSSTGPPRSLGPKAS